MSVSIRFLPDDITIDAEPGASLLQTAEQAGILIPTGCLMGSCHACEVEIEGIGNLCACIAAVPAQHTQLTVHLFTDPTW